MTTPWLQGTPGIWRSSGHRYWLNGEPLAVSVTGVVGEAKSQQAMNAIEATREHWEPRGLACHRALELFLTSGYAWRPEDDEQSQPWLEWIEPLLAHPIWEQVQPIASELMMGCAEMSCGGTFDGGLLAPDGRRIQFDLKTQARADAGPYPTLAQHGGYLQLGDTLGLEWDSCLTIWSRPGKVSLQPLDALACRGAWAELWHTHCARHRPW